MSRQALTCIELSLPFQAAVHSVRLHCQHACNACQMLTQPRVADKPEAFGAFFQQFLDLKSYRVLHAHERLTYLLFCIHALQSLETPVVWAQVRKLVSLPLWHALSPGRLQVCT